MNPSTTPSAATAPGKRTSRAAPRPKAKAKPKRRKLDPVKVWANTLRRYRPGLPQYVLDQLAERYGAPVWERRLDPVSELILTILTQNTADVNAEVAFQRLREAYPGSGPVEEHHPGIGWGGVGLPPGVAPDWQAVENAADRWSSPTSSAPAVSRNQKAPRLQATLRRIREERGDYSLEFLGDMPALEARDWLTAIPGIGRKTASIVLLFCFGTAAHARRPACRAREPKRIGLLPKKATADQAHDFYPRPARARPDVRRARAAHPSRPRDLPRPTTRARALSRARPVPVRGPQGALTPGAASEAPHVRSARPCRRPPRRRVRRLARHGQRARPHGIRRTHSTTCPPTRSRAATRTPRRSSPASTPWGTADLRADEPIDRDLATRRAPRPDDRGRLAGWKRDPLTYSSPVTSGIFTLFLHRLRPERELVDASIARWARSRAAWTRASPISIPRSPSR